MEPLFSMTTLQRNPSAVKESAQRELVRVTEQGGAGYVFASEDVFERFIARERADAAYEARLMEAVGRGIADIDAGRFTTDVDEAFSRASALRGRCA